MRKFLLILPVLMLFLSCHQKAKQSAASNSDPENFKEFSLNAESFIPYLDDELNETSGLIYFDSLLWTINDSGGRNCFYGFDFNGKIKREVILHEADNIDWEEIAQDNENIYIGDFGNNRGTRKNLKIYQVRKAGLSANRKQVAESSVISFSYNEQTSFLPFNMNTPFDCESLVEFNDYLYLFTKDWENQTSGIYRLSKHKRKQNRSAELTFNANGLISGADVSPDKTKLALIGYKNYIPILLVFNGISEENILGTEKYYVRMDSLRGAQTEGICFLNNDSLLISCERTSNYNQQVFLFDINKLNQNGITDSIR